VGCAGRDRSNSVLHNQELAEKIMRTPQEIQTAFAPREFLATASGYFLVGIGGAGMSALARLLHRQGFPVAGSDLGGGEEVDRLRSEGILVTIGHTEEALASFADERTAVVFSDAIDLGTNPERAMARKLNLRIFRRSQLLGFLLRNHKVIAVTGTHGKTTTTGLLGSAFIEAGLEPLVVVGASIPAWNGPVHYGAGEWAVVEACEAYDSFHDLDPHFVVLTNLELDHVDFHRNWENLRSSILRFVNRIPEFGMLIFCGEDSGAKEIANSTQVPRMPYGETDWPSDVPLSLPGHHNRLNAAGALRAAIAAGIGSDQAVRAIAEFTGAERRLQLIDDCHISNLGHVTVIDDYAHHPSEITAGIQALRERYKNRRLVVVYQPHLYSRTENLIPEFAKALEHADFVVLTDIYPAREAPIPGVSSARIAEHISKPLKYVSNRHLLPRKVARWLQDGDVVVGMGAGNIQQFPPALVLELKRFSTSKPSVLVAYGGDSAEREVSLLSGRAVYEALIRKGYSARLADLSDLAISSGNFDFLTGPNRPDVVFLAVHGTHAEDGAIQGLLETFHIPYTGSGVQSSAIAMDKDLTKATLARHGIRTPRGIRVNSTETAVPLEAPIIVKPNAQGSTVGMAFLETKEELSEAIRRALMYDDSALVEEWVRGIEVSVPVLGDRVLLPVEIAPKSGRYDFSSKYTVGATEEIVPARLRQELIQQIEQTALAAHHALGCRGATRTDMIIRDAEGVPEIFVLEVNTLPGLTGTSLLPNSARAAGIEFDELCEKIISEALKYEAA
jgi:D-alanine--D-alanine ligase